MNVEIGAEAAKFPEKEYINGIAVAVHIVTSFYVVYAWVCEELTKSILFRKVNSVRIYGNG